MNNRYITFNGETMNLKEWAGRLGIKAVTLNARLVRYGMPLEKAMQAKSLQRQASGFTYKVKDGDYEHRRVAEKALGKPLPPGALVHHVDENPFNNTPTNLVICPDDAYHLLLHQRQRAFNACGHYDWRKCRYCNQWNSPYALTITKQNKAHHPRCHADYHAELRRKTQ